MTEEDAAKHGAAGTAAPAISPVGAVSPRVLTPDINDVRPTRKRPGVGRLGERYALLGVWALVAAVFGVLRPETFLSSGNFQTIFGSQSVLIVLTLGVVIALNSGAFDLSAGACLGFGAMTLAYLNVETGLPIALALPAVLVIAVVFGLFNAFLVVRVGVPPVVATLGSGTFLTGISLLLSSQVVYGVSTGYVDFLRARPLLGLPIAFWLALMLCVAVHYMLEHTPIGRYLVFIGKGPEVARLAGVRVDLLRTIALVISSVFSMSAGIVLVGLVGSAAPGGGGSFLLPAFAAAFLGETTIRPGQFNVWGSFVAVYFLVTGITGLQLMGAAGWVEQAFYGGSLVAAVAAAQLVVKRTDKRERVRQLAS